jgi:hypothetical protein
MMALSVPGSRISCRNTSFSDIVKIIVVSSKTENMQASYQSDIPFVTAFPYTPFPTLVVLGVDSTK